MTSGPPPRPRIRPATRIRNGRGLTIGGRKSPAAHTGGTIQLRVCRGRDPAHRPTRCLSGEVRDHTQLPRGTGRSDLLSTSTRTGSPVVSSVRSSVPLRPFWMYLSPHRTSAKDTGSRSRPFSVKHMFVPGALPRLRVAPPLEQPAAVRSRNRLGNTDSFRKGIETRCTAIVLPPNLHRRASTNYSHSLIEHCASHLTVRSARSPPRHTASIPSAYKLT